MTAVAASDARCDAGRLRRLRAMGLKPWRLRMRASVAGCDAEAFDARCVVRVASAALADARRRRLLDAALATLGLAGAALRIEPLGAAVAATATVTAPPTLVFGGDPQLGQESSAATQVATLAALLDAPLRKRELWHVLKALRRSLREG